MAAVLEMGDNMTRAQEIIVAYVETQWDMTGIQVGLKGYDVVVITDSTGDTLELTTNLYGDIIDVSSRKILAASNLPHDIRKLNQEDVPTSWLTYPYPGI